MKLKLNEQGFAVVQDGKPVYTDDNGAEIPFDAPAAMAKITELNGEAKTHRLAKEDLASKYKPFEGLDPEAARKALDTMSALDQKKLIDAGEVQKVRDEAIKAVRAEYEPVLKERDTLKSQLDTEIRGGSFARSKFAEDKVAVPRHMLERTYGDNFKVEDGKLVPYDANGNKIYSRVKPGEIAEFDEALEQLISADPYKDHILKGSGGSGSGAPGTKGGTVDKKFDNLSPVERITAARAAGQKT